MTLVNRRLIGAARKEVLRRFCNTYVTTAFGTAERLVHQTPTIGHASGGIIDCIRIPMLFRQSTLSTTVAHYIHDVPEELAKRWE